MQINEYAKKALIDVMDELKIKQKKNVWEILHEDTFSLYDVDINNSKIILIINSENFEDEEIIEPVDILITLYYPNGDESFDRLKDKLDSEYISYEELSDEELIKTVNPIGTDFNIDELLFENILTGDKTKLKGDFKIQSIYDKIIMDGE